MPYVIHCIFELCLLGSFQFPIYFYQLARGTSKHAFLDILSDLELSSVCNLLYLWYFILCFGKLNYRIFHSIEWVIGTWEKGDTSWSKCSAHNLHHSNSDFASSSLFSLVEHKPTSVFHPAPMQDFQAGCRGVYSLMVFSSCSAKASRGSSLEEAGSLREGREGLTRGWEKCPLRWEALPRGPLLRRAS